MSYKEAGNNPGLHPLKRQFPGFSSRTRAQNKFSSLSLSTDKNPPHCNMLVAQLALYLIYYILSRDQQGQFKSNELVNSSLCWELIGDSGVKEMIKFPWRLVLKVFIRSCMYLKFLSAFITRRSNRTLSAIWEKFDRIRMQYAI